MTTIRFNTGRSYTAAGQRIVATLHADNVVTFMDHDRGVSGEFTMTHPQFFGEHQVMARYDHGTFKGSSRSWADGMARDGINALKGE